MEVRITISDATTDTVKVVSEPSAQPDAAVAAQAVQLGALNAGPAPGAAAFSGVPSASGTGSATTVADALSAGAAPSP